MKRLFLVLLNLVCVKLLFSGINVGVPKVLIPEPSPTYQKIHIRGYSVDTVNGKIYVAGKFKSYDGKNKQPDSFYDI